MDQNVSAQGRPSPDQSDPVPPARGLKIAVIVMGVILIIGFTTVFITIAYRVANSPAVAPVAAGSSFETGLAIPAGAEIAGMEITDDRAVVTVKDADGTYLVIVLDIDKGRSVGRFVLRPE